MSKIRKNNRGNENKLSSFLKKRNEALNCYNKSGEINISSPGSEQTVTVLIGGDMYLHGNLLVAVEKGKSQKVIADIMSEIASSDFSIVNLEAPLTENTKHILKSGPALKMPPFAVKLLNETQIDAVTLANNHTGDYGPQGVLDTIHTLDMNNIKHVGAGEDLATANIPLTLKKNGLSFAIINIAENEFGVAEESLPGIAPFDILENLKLVKNTAETVDILIVIAHAGTEHYPIPRPELRKLYRAFIEAGAKAVVGHHPHCAQGMEILNNAPIIYSLGNFMFPHRDPDKFKITPSSLWHWGYMVKIEFSSKQVCRVNLIPYSQFADGKTWHTLKQVQLEHFLKYFMQLSDITSDDHKVKRFFDAWTFLNQERLIEWLNWSVALGESYPMLHVKNEFWCEAHCELAKNILMLMQKNELNDADEFVPQLKEIINAFSSEK